MGKRNRNTTPVAPVEQPVAPVAKSNGGRIRLALSQAVAHNKQWSLATPAPSANVIAGTVKGTNPKRARVYGYNNLANGGGVPKQAVVKLTLVDCPKGVNAGQWAALVAAVNSNPASTVESLKGQGIVGKTFRRAYRNGGIQFIQQ